VGRLIALVHTVATLVPEFDRLCGEILPDAEVKHMLDEPLLERVRRRGRLAPEDAARLEAHLQIAAEIGAAAVLVTCSTISPCVDEVRGRVTVPLIKIDEAMLAEALRLGTRIGVVATIPTTLEPTRKSLLAQAETSGRVVAMELVLVEGALAALLGGDGETHDRLVARAVRNLAGRVDVVILAQASTARAVRVITESPVPVLASPRLALERVRGLMIEPPINADQRR
jgi:Asp/Glu/hydantoin racemase